MRHIPAKGIDRPLGVCPGTKPVYGSDAIVELLRALNIEYISFTPGGSFTGLHESLVNYGGNTKPQLLLCTHEEIAVSMAHGYAKAAGRPMAVALHTNVGMLHACLPIYNLWCDRVPCLLLGGTGPMDAARRIWVNWIHTALIPGNHIREFVKWDDQPFSVEAVPESLLRAYRIAVTEPAGPVYVCIDKELQKARLPANFELPEVSHYPPPMPIEPNHKSLQEMAHRLVQANLPLCFTNRLGGKGMAFESLSELASLLAMAVVDGIPRFDAGDRVSIPTEHPMDLTATGISLLKDADLVLGLDPVNLAHFLRLAPETVKRRPFIVTISMDELSLRGWSPDHYALPPTDIAIVADTRLAVPALVEYCRELVSSSREARDRIESRRLRLEALHNAQRAQERRAIAEHAKDQPISLLRLGADVFDAIRNEDWVLVKGQPRRRMPGAFEFRRGDQYLGDSGGQGLGYGPGAALGAALALSARGQLPVALMGDGDFAMGTGVLWTAAHYQIPLLLVIYNNRSYYTDESQLERMARERERSEGNQGIGVRLEQPTIDFAALARVYGLHGEGPITDPDELGPALRRAISAVKEGRLALVDVWTQNR